MVKEEENKDDDNKEEENKAQENKEGDKVVGKEQEALNDPKDPYKGKYF